MARSIGDVHYASFFVHPSIAIQLIILLQPDPIELTALIYLQPGAGKGSLRITGRNVTRIFGNILDQRVHRRLCGSLAVIEKSVEPLEPEHAEYGYHH